MAKQSAEKTESPICGLNVFWFLLMCAIPLTLVLGVNGFTDIFIQHNWLRASTPKIGNYIHRANGGTLGGTHEMANRVKLMCSVELGCRSVHLCFHWICPRVPINSNSLSTTHYVSIKNVLLCEWAATKAHLSDFVLTRVSLHIVYRHRIHNGDLAKPRKNSILEKYLKKKQKKQETYYVKQRKNRFIYVSPPPFTVTFGGKKRI